VTVECLCNPCVQMISNSEDWEGSMRSNIGTMFKAYLIICNKS